MMDTPRNLRPDLLNYQIYIRFRSDDRVRWWMSSPSPRPRPRPRLRLRLRVGLRLRLRWCAVGGFMWCGIVLMVSVCRLIGVDV
ncbi:hypothetical protein BO94DRAFT_540546 [Aspergillus sclerotioniger CBS 115572]|uniref:Uncharacterized protein n=1 Tax=Aspergillus sclerotioniger CBS 115572 TaxID=1450535 RepID=A0A317UZM2_9EURO|nr:hypothetical protein BO94DRAFT_540546 [Aspergillus sclerotioniger CBS 115572]PWY67136.1 hypothetical protein BO94DRAFT_540546 [Aspergillus sclerotioniger CBS 115572]